MKDENKHLNDNGTNLYTANEEEDAVKLSSIPVSMFDPMLLLILVVYKFHI